MSLSSGIELAQAPPVRQRIQPAAISAGGLPQAWSPRRAFGFIALSSLVLWSLLLGAALLLLS